MTTAIVLFVGCFVFLAIGSFTCVVIDRLPYRREEPDEFGDTWGSRPWREVVQGGSRCSGCGAPISPFDNVPVASFVVLRGRCRSCGVKIPRYHPAVELAAPVAFVLAVWSLGETWLLMPILWFIPVALALAVIDLRIHILPTAIIWPSTIVLVLLSVASLALVGFGDQWGRLLTALVGVATVAGPLFLLWFAVPSGMGFGDVRLSVSIGWVVGFYGGVRPASGVVLGVITLLVASVLGIVIGVAALGVRGRRARIPFGPSFVLGAFVVALLAPEILGPWTLYSG